MARNSSDKAKKAIKSGYQVKEDKPTKDKQTKQKEQKSSSKKNDVKKSKAKVSFPKPKSGKQGAPKKSNKSPSSKSPKKASTKKPLERERKNKIGKPGPNIKWRDKDNERLRKAVKSVNAKATRLNKKGYNNLTKLSVKNIKHDVRTREEFNQLLKDIEAFTEYGSEKKQKKSHLWNYEKTYASLRHRTNEERKEDLLNEYDNETIYDRGKKLGVRKDRSEKNKFIDETVAALQPEDLNFDNRSKFIRSMNSINRDLDKKRTRASNQQYKDNYYEAARKYIGDEDILAIIRMLSPEDLVELARTDVNGDIEYLYTVDDMQKYKLMRMYSRFTGDIRDKYMRDMKRKGVPEDTLKKMSELSDSRFSKLMFTYERVEMLNPFGEPHVEYNYNRNEDVNKVIEAVNRYKR